MDTEPDQAPSTDSDLLNEQIAYYRALSADYLDQGSDLHGARELTGALDAFQPAGSVQLGWDIKVTSTGAPYYWGAGRRSPGRTS